MLGCVTRQQGLDELQHFGLILIGEILEEGKQLLLVPRCGDDGVDDWVIAGIEEVCNLHIDLLG